MHNLPIELVKAIVENISDAADLFHLRTVNSTCRDLVTANLFRKVCVQNSVKSAQNIHQIFTTPSLASHVHEVVYDSRKAHSFPLLDPSHGQDDCDELEIADLEDALTETFCSLADLPNLKSVTLNFWPFFISQSGVETHEHPYWFTNRQLTVLHSVYHAMQTTSSLFPNRGIRSLTMTNVVLMPRPCYDFVRSLTDSPLTHLSISVVSNVELSSWSGSKTANRSVDALLPVPNTRLTSLEIRSPNGLYHSPTAQLNAYTYPALKNLAVQNIIFPDTSSDDGMEEFIMRHKNTLRRLEMKSCVNYVQTSNNTPIRKWATIWERLREELSELVELVVDLDHESGYVLQSADGYLRHSSLPATVPGLAEEDEQSLKEFYEHVNARAVGTLRC
ncbi:hypothetical protein V8B97DRAFT_2008897 [Scleroderma yunnanense]